MHPNSYRRFTMMAGAINAAMGFLVLLGWHTHTPLLIQVRPEFVPMQYNTAICFLLLGVGLIAVARNARRVALPAAALVGFVALLTLAQYAFSVDLGIDRLLFEPYVFTRTSHPGGRMAPLTVFSFLLAAGALACLNLRPARPLLATILGVGVISSGLAVAANYLLDLENIYGWSQLTRMAANTAAAFIVYGAGLVALALSLLPAGPAPAGARAGERGRPGKGLETRIALGYGLAFVLLLAVGLAAQFAIRQTVETESLVAHTHLIAAHLEELHSQLRDVQRGSRGFVITGDDRFLEPYHSGRDTIEKEMAALRTLILDDAQRQRLAEAEPLLHRALNVFAGVVETRRSKGFLAAVEEVRKGEGQVTMDEFRRQIMSMKAAQDELLRQRSELSRRTAQLTQRIILAGGLLALVVVVGSVVVTYRGLSARNRAERRLAQSEEEARRQAAVLQSVLNNMGDGVIVADEQGKFLLFNPAAERTLGLGAIEAGPEEWPQQYRAYLPDGETLFATEELPLVRAIRGESVDGVEMIIRAPGRSSDTWISLNGRSLVGEDGRACGGVIVFRDVTLAKQAEARFRGILEAAPDAMIIVNAEGRIVLANSRSEQLFGYPREEMLGRGIEFLVPERFRLEHTGLRNVFLGNPATRMMGQGREVAAARKDGTEVPVEISLSVLEASEGVLVTAAIRDITTRKQAEEHLHQLNRSLEQRTAEVEAINKELEAFTYSVSHDLRAPLRHVDGFSQILVEQYGPQLDAQAQHYLQRVRDGAQHMGRLVDDLLNLARVGRRDLKPQLAGLNSIVEEVLRELKPETDARNIEWRIGKLPFVECDAALMKQVFANLLSNSVKYTRPRDKAVIEVSQKSDNGETVLYVRDNGVGFSMKYAGKLFGIFQRLHRQEDFEGTGVGLATVQRIIARHSGRVWAEAEVDKGATFYFTLGEIHQEDQVGALLAAPSGGKQ